MADFLLTVLYILAIILPLLLAVAYLTYAERKVMAAVQIRRGPNVVGRCRLPERKDPIVMQIGRPRPQPSWPRLL